MGAAVAVPVETAVPVGVAELVETAVAVPVAVADDVGVAVGAADRIALMPERRSGAVTATGSALA